MPWLASLVASMGHSLVLVACPGALHKWYMSPQDAQCIYQIEANISQSGQSSSFAGFQNGLKGPVPEQFVRDDNHGSGE